MGSGQGEDAPLVLRADRLDVALVMHLSRAWVVEVWEEAEGIIIYKLTKP